MVVAGVARARPGRALASPPGRSSLQGGPQGPRCPKDVMRCLLGGLANLDRWGRVGVWCFTSGLPRKARQGRARTGAGVSRGVNRKASWSARLAPCRNSFCFLYLRVGAIGLEPMTPSLSKCFGVFPPLSTLFSGRLRCNGLRRFWILPESTDFSGYLLPWLQNGYTEGMRSLPWLAAGKPIDPSRVAKGIRYRVPTGLSFSGENRGVAAPVGLCS